MSAEPIRQRAYIIERGTELLHVNGPPTIEWMYVDHTSELSDVAECFADAIGQWMPRIALDDVLTRNPSIEFHWRVRRGTLVIE